jgi:hypothetical protein
MKKGIDYRLEKVPPRCLTRGQILSQMTWLFTTCILLVALKNKLFRELLVGDELIIVPLMLILIIGKFVANQESEAHFNVSTYN